MGEAGEGEKKGGEGSLRKEGPWFLITGSHGSLYRVGEETENTEPGKPSRQCPYSCWLRNQNGRTERNKNFKEQTSSHLTIKYVFKILNYKTTLDKKEQEYIFSLDPAYPEDSHLTQLHTVPEPGKVSWCLTFNCMMTGFPCSVSFPISATPGRLIQLTFLSLGVLICTVGQWVWLLHLGRIQKDGIRMLPTGRAVSRWKDWINRHAIIVKQDSWGFPVWPCTFPRPGLLCTDTGTVAEQGRRKAEHSAVFRTEKGALLLCTEWLLSVRRWLLGERRARDWLLQLFFPYSD